MASASRSLFLLRLLMIMTSTVWQIRAAEDVAGDASYFDHPSFQHGQLHHRGRFKHLSCGKLYYRSFYLDDSRGYLYVGAMDRIMRLDSFNISQTDCKKDSLLLEPESSYISECLSKGKNQHYDCRNHVRVIQPLGDGERLYVCGTNAHSPKDLVINANLTHLRRFEYVPGVGSGVAKCPFDPDDNSTALWVRHGNPGDLPALYSGTVAEFTKADHIIFRADLYNLTAPAQRRPLFPFKRTIKYNSKWLDKPNFVASYDIGEYVYFFFRETALEYINCGKAIYSRVARVCKRDMGGKNILDQNWTTYIKARLNCSLPGEFPFYFNEIQAMYKAPGDDTHFYAVFTTSMNGLTGSAICTFSLRSIQDTFEGRFKEQRTSMSAWLPVSRSAVPSPRPGRCVTNTQQLPDSVLTFIQSHPLLDNAVPHSHGRPVFYLRDLVLTSLVVDQVTTDTFGYRRRYHVYYAGSNTGLVYKLVSWVESNGAATPTVKSSLLDVYRATYPEPVRQMAISSRRTQALYVSSDSAIRQIDLYMCNQRFDNCVRCVHDPYCGWDKEQAACRPYAAGLLQDVEGREPGVCDSSAVRQRVNATWGQTLHLGCSVQLPEQMRRQRRQQRAAPTVVWFLWNKNKGRHRVSLRPDKYVATVDDGLVVLSVNEADAGRYEARLASGTIADASVENSAVSDESSDASGALLCVYNVHVDTERCAAPRRAADYRRVYSEWCDQLQQYRRALQSWQHRQTQCHRSSFADSSASSSISSEVSLRHS